MLQGLRKLWTRLFWDEGRITRIEEEQKLMVKQTDLDTIIAGLPANTEKAVSDAVTPIIAPIVAKLNAIPDVDFTPEADQLNALPGAVATSVAAAIAAAFAPVTTPPVKTDPGTTTTPDPTASTGSTTTTGTAAAP